MRVRSPPELLIFHGSVVELAYTLALEASAFGYMGSTPIWSTGFSRRRFGYSLPGNRGGAMGVIEFLVVVILIVILAKAVLSVL